MEYKIKASQILFYKGQFDETDTKLRELIEKLPMDNVAVNDILDVKISTLNPETAIPYNSVLSTSGPVPSIELMKLQGHLVNTEGKIALPILGEIAASGKTTSELEKNIICECDIPFCQGTIQPNLA